jgi:hypothetical protein
MHASFQRRQRRIGADSAAAGARRRPAVVNEHDSARAAVSFSVARPRGRRVIEPSVALAW